MSARCGCWTMRSGSVVLQHSDAEVLRAAGRLYNDLTQILRLCVTGRFKLEAAGEACCA